MTTAKDIHTAMTDLRAGRITADEYRAIMRASREQNGDEAHNALKFAACAADNRED